MRLTLIGMGSGWPETLTSQALSALQMAELIVGPARLLEHLPSGCTANRVCAYKTDDILRNIGEANCERAAVLFSGDSGFYSGAELLVPRLKEKNMDFCVLPGLSSVQLLAASLGRPWQGWRLASAHGAACDAVAECMHGAPVFFLTGGAETPATLCAQLVCAGLGDLNATVGEWLGTPRQRIRTGTARQLAAECFEPLSVLLTEAAPQPPRRCAGLPDTAFVRGEVPMTKQEVRAAALAKLGVRFDDILWDIGAGTGSVSIELALAAPRGHVFAVECGRQACELIKQNRESFRAYNLTLIEGVAPQALCALPAPDAVFIGGTKGKMADIIDAVLQKSPSARVCAAAITIESLQAAIASLTSHGIEAHVTQLAVSRTREAGSVHMLLANNPIFLVTGNCQ